MKIQDLKQGTTEQYSLEWWRERLGKITGSEAWKLMSKGRKKEQKFSATGIKYLCKVRGERFLDPDMLADDEEFGNWINRCQKSSKAMEWGHNQEGNALGTFSLLVKIDEDVAPVFGGLAIKTVGSCGHPTIDGFNSSPDGVMVNADGDVIACIEIKCPDTDTHAFYTEMLTDAASLLEEKPEYYWQTMSHMAVTGASCCFFIWYDPAMYESCQYIMIPRDDEAIAQLEQKVKDAREGIENGIKSLV